MTIGQRTRPSTPRATRTSAPSDKIRSVTRLWSSTSRSRGYRPPCRSQCHLRRASVARGFGATSRSGSSRSGGRSCPWPAGRARRGLRCPWFVFADIGPWLSRSAGRTSQWAGRGRCTAQIGLVDFGTLKYWQRTESHWSIRPACDCRWPGMPGRCKRHTSGVSFPAYSPDVMISRAGAWAVSFWFEETRWPDGPFCPHCGSCNVQVNATLPT